MYDQFPGVVQPFIWSDRLPEFLHISLALIDVPYGKVAEDFQLVCDRVKTLANAPRFHFNLSDTIKLIAKHPEIWDLIGQTCFKTAFDQLLPLYAPLLGLKPKPREKANPELVMRAFDQILDGRSDVAILGKYMMMRTAHGDRPDPFRIFVYVKKEEILSPENVSSVMASFPPSLGLHGNFDLDWCQQVWLLNYVSIPPIFRQNTQMQEEEHFRTTRVEEHTAKLKLAYEDFRRVQFLAFYSRALDELIIGSVARVCDLSFDVIELVKKHQGEIAELVFRSTLESFIVFSWLMKRKDPELFSRFRDYSTGRERFFGEKMAEQAADEEMKRVAKAVVKKTVKEAGTREINVAAERGDVFDVKIDQMAQEVWGETNSYYMMYKRASDVVHGHWRVITKYHLEKSKNPMHNGLYMHKADPNSYSGVTTAFVALEVAASAMLTALADIDDADVNKLREEVLGLRQGAMEDYAKYSKEMFTARAAEVDDHKAQEDETDA